MDRFLRSEDERGVFPHGAHASIITETERGYIFARNALNGHLSARTRAGIVAWLRVDDQTADDALCALVRDKLRNDPKWNQTWPYSLNDLARLCDVAPPTLRPFIERKRRIDHNALNKIESFLVSRGALEAPPALGGRKPSSYRTDRGIEAKLETFVVAHPRNCGAGPWPMRWNVTNSSRGAGISLFEALRFCIPAAGLTVLGVFQARRESELGSLKTDCISEEAGQLWLESHIGKTLRRDRKLPTVRLAEATVKFLTRWSTRGREQLQSDHLFTYWEPLGQALTVTKPNETLKRFASLVLPTTALGSLQVRQFRRFFAITFMWRYRLGSLPALSDFLCHSGLTMTWEYVTERVGTTVMREAQAEFSKEILMSAALGQTKLRGSFGRTWTRWVEKVRSDVRKSVDSIASAEEFNRAFLVRVENGIRLLLPTPGGFCAAGDRDRDTKRAMCAAPDPDVPGRLVKKPQLARPSQCACCPHGATDDLHRIYWEGAARDARQAACASKPSILRERAAVEAPLLERAVERFFPIQPVA